MSINQRFNRIIKTLYNGNKSAFSNAIGVTPSVVENIVGKRQGNPSFEVLEKVSAIAEISPEWLLTGHGEMLRKDNREDITATLTPDYTGIPVIPTEAMAGFLTGEVSVYEDTCERVTIPGLKADFIIPVSGDSMQPLYFSGDYVACQHVNLGDIFFQWGRVYVINTSQGVLIKKVRRSGSNDTILLISENPDYDPFELPLADIYQISIVKGLIRIV